MNTTGNRHRRFHTMLASAGKHYRKMLPSTSDPVHSDSTTDSDTSASAFNATNARPAASKNANASGHRDASTVSKAAAQHAPTTQSFVQKSKPKPRPRASPEEVLANRRRAAAEKEAEEEMGAKIKAEKLRRNTSFQKTRDPSRTISGATLDRYEGSWEVYAKQLEEEDRRTTSPSKDDDEEDEGQNERSRYRSELLIIAILRIIMRSTPSVTLRSFFFKNFSPLLPVRYLVTYKS
jgi:hypothetical protein